MPQGDAGDFSQAVLEEAKQQAEEIVTLARREAERILDGAREELNEAYRAEQQHAATQKAKTRYRQIVAAAELEAQKQRLLTQERLITKVLDQVQDRLLQVRETPQYPDLLLSLIREGVENVEGDQFEIIVDQADRDLITEALLTKLSTDTGATLTLSDNSQSGITGVIIQRADGRVRYDNSLQGILHRQKDRIRLLIAQELFEESEEH
ncbi:hypothetical protein GF339_11885 [candidate division KSB3 bacterium]|uniref:V-type proton ATPase subunit E n=1 Tax=candidate division KSB3 bacterium TaxID=2044937 RepID=A0A9D5JW81_9BACT|nr:hypothetical protein [candidate division KSB3 bacterium]MBD3325279.1 hypothetical protein [candidate division KSB3 bacterium]